MQKLQTKGFFSEPGVAAIDEDEALNGSSLMLLFKNGEGADEAAAAAAKAAAGGNTLGIPGNTLG
jgi:hypothetical protein